jgi:hypothetical protein
MCGIRTTGTVLCWGYNSDGQSTVPSGTFVQVAANAVDSHTCGIRTDGTVLCWGLNNFGQSTAPSGTFVQVAAGSGHTCGIRTDGTVWCWGSNSDGKSTAPSGTFVQVAAGGLHSCGKLADSSVLCWGSSSRKQLEVPLICGNVAPKSYARIGLTQVPCLLGSYSASAGAITVLCSGLCAAGRYGFSSSNNSPDCSGACPIGHFCPAGTVTPPLVQLVVTVNPQDYKIPVALVPVQLVITVQLVQRLRRNLVVQAAAMVTSKDCLIQLVPVYVKLVIGAL